ncbi:MAG TPA: CRISPR system precrRNA processing endoribonuclease RAMP protein Cas6 [Nostocaceae cyanobacterium]|nr:CRISPR system precrRNA processing endoribonuclease RAMP protein Cas6 [Nostocaceae cyanobacterium]
MTSTKDTEVMVTGLNLVFKPTENFISSTPLISCLSEIQPTLALIPLKTVGGVTKIMPVLPNVDFYPHLIQSIYQQINSCRCGLSSPLKWQQKFYELTGIEVNTSTLHIVKISFSPTLSPLPTLGRAINAQCFQWFANANPALAADLHQQESLPFTVAVEYIALKKMQMRITLLKPELLAPFLWGLNTSLGSEIILADIPCRLDRQVDIAYISSFEKLAQLPAQNVIKLHFLSPTSFKQNKHIQPFPLPELVFGSLLRRWNKFAPQDLHFPIIDWQGIVSAFEIKTHALKMEGGAEIGAEGWVKYRFLDSEQARVATILANFAVFSGVGRKTGMGMGYVKAKFNS